MLFGAAVFGAQNKIVEPTTWVQNTLGNGQVWLFIIQVYCNANSPLHGYARHPGPNYPNSYIAVHSYIEGYTPAALAARPAARVRNHSDSKQGRQFDVIVFPTFSYSTPLHWAIRPLGTLFSFLSPPPPRLPVCVGARAWGDGECRVM